MRTRDYVSFHIQFESERRDWEFFLLEVFDEEVKELFRRHVTFEIGVEKLKASCSELGKIIMQLLSDREFNNSKMPSELLEARVLGNQLQLNMREMTDKFLFWLSRVYNLMEDAGIYKYNLIFFHSDGFAPDVILNPYIRIE